ncbi:unnamed protein product, partial [Durusdinium trenchii]
MPSVMKAMKGTKAMKTMKATQPMKYQEHDHQPDQDHDEEMASASSTPSVSVRDPWSRYWEQTGKPFQDAPWRQKKPLPSDEATVGNTNALQSEDIPVAGSSSKVASPVANEPGNVSRESTPKSSRSKPPKNFNTGWRSKMVWVVAWYQNQDWLIIEEKLQQMEDQLQGGAMSNQSWKFKAQRFFQYYKEQRWSDIDQLIQ